MRNEQFSFSQLQNLLLFKGLVAPLGQEPQIEDPVRFTYLMDLSSGTTMGQPPSANEDAAASLLQFDCDIMVPNLLSARWRQLLHRHKSRGVIYATARAQVAKRRTSSSHLLLADAAAGAARREAHIDARMEYLMEQLQERAQ